MTPRSRQENRPGPGGMTCRAIRAVLGALLLLLAGVATTAAQTEEEGPYELKPGDRVSVSVLEDPMLDREALIAPDGRIALPLAGSLKAEGLTPAQLQGVVRRRLRSRFVEPPTVTVSLVALGEPEEEDTPREVYVLGEVKNPGLYKYDPETTINVLQALTMAGGPGPFAATGRIQVRQTEGEIQILRLFDYEAVEDGLINTPRDLEALGDGAVIIVPERGLFE